MKVVIELTEKDLKELVLREISNRALNLDAEIKMSDIKFLVKSKQNYSAEWEEATFMAMYINHNQK